MSVKIIYIYSWCNLSLIYYLFNNFRCPDKCMVSCILCIIFSQCLCQGVVLIWMSLNHSLREKLPCAYVKYIYLADQSRMQYIIFCTHQSNLDRVMSATSISQKPILKRSSILLVLRMRRHSLTQWSSFIIKCYRHQNIYASISYL